MTIRENYAKIVDDIAESAARSGRNFEDIELVAVTKYVDIERIAEAIEVGASSIGENRVQEFLSKRDFFNEKCVRKNIIGQLQTNKVKYVVGEVDLIQSVDRMDLALAISKRASALQITQRILVEVNIGDEPQKGGAAASSVFDLIREISVLPNIKVCGLMCIPPMLGEVGLRKCFKSMRELFLSIGESGMENVSMDVLSMGMSGDYKIAVEEGANMVRVGSALFGPRN